MVTLPDGPVSKLSLGYLASYEGMGWAQVECLGACSCTVLKIDANSTARASQEHFANIDIERQNDGASCLLKVASLNQSSSIDNGHKFKVSSVAWSGEQTGSESTSAAAQHQHSSSASVQSTETVTQQNATQSPQPETVKSEPDDLQAEPDLMLGNM